MSKTDDYARNADECRRMAVVAKSDQEQRSWLRLAESWLKMMRTAVADEAPILASARAVEIAQDKP